VSVPDAELVCRAQGGDAGAFSTLVERHWLRLVPFARSIVGDAEAEDAVQDGFVQAWDKLRTLRSPEAFRSWLLRIVGRQCLQRTRRSRRFLSLVSVGEDPPDPASAAPGEDADVERILGLLAPRQRAVMHLTVFEGMSDSEIGGVLAIEAASVRSHRRRAKERLRELLGPAVEGR
jgi:RNA polymerase sigma-70 factor (ECF subfamily)